MTLLRVGFIVAFCAIFIALILAFAQGFLFVDPIGAFHVPDKSNDRLYDIAPYLAAVVQSVENIASMLLTIQIGLFVIVGFFMQMFLAKNAYEVRWALVLTISLFLIVSFMAFYLGYAARLQVFELVNAGKVEFDPVEITLARQALLVALSAVIAIVIASLTMFALSGAGVLGGDRVKPEERTSTSSIVLAEERTNRDDSADT